LVNHNPTVKHGMHSSAKQLKPKDRHARSEHRRSRRLLALRHSNTSKSITLVRIILVRNIWRVWKARHVLAFFGPGIRTALKNRWKGRRNSVCCRLSLSPRCSACQADSRSSAESGVPMPIAGRKWNTVAPTTDCLAKRHSSYARPDKGKNITRRAFASLCSAPCRRRLGQGLPDAFSAELSKAREAARPFRLSFFTGFGARSFGALTSRTSSSGAGSLTSGSTIRAKRLVSSRRIRTELLKASPARVMNLASLAPGSGVAVWSCSPLPWVLP